MRSTFLPLLFSVATTVAARSAAAEPAVPAADLAATATATIPTPAAADTPPQQDPAAYVEPENEQRGWVLSLPATIAVPGGQFAEGLDASSFGVGAGFGVLFGYYASEHFGILGGLTGSTSHQGFSDCRPKNDCKGVRYQFPVVAQYALRNRKQGLFLQGGFGFASTYSITQEGDGRFTVSAPFDVKLGFGYRIPQGALAKTPATKPSRWSVDLFGQFDFGQFQSVSGSTSRGRVDTDIAQPATHYLAEFGVALHWTP
ncbi:MAG: hypothetical protein ABW133_13520 [Polyangiaceae bacterium]